MTSHEREPYNLPWREDEDGWYLTIASDEGTFELRPCNTDVYTHDEQFKAVDHIFYEHYTNEDEVAMGFRIWRESVDSLLGEGMFDRLKEDMRCRNFFEIHVDKPTDEDMKYYIQTYGELVIPQESIEHIAHVAMANWDAEWKYYSQES